MFSESTKALELIPCDTFPPFHYVIKFFIVGAMDKLPRVEMLCDRSIALMHQQRLVSTWASGVKKGTPESQETSTREKQIRWGMSSARWTEACSIFNLVSALLYTFHSDTFLPLYKILTWKKKTFWIMCENQKRLLLTDKFTMPQKIFKNAL